jgi:hypothetical protein
MDVAVFRPLKVLLKNVVHLWIIQNVVFFVCNTLERLVPHQGEINRLMLMMIPNQIQFEQ